MPYVIKPTGNRAKPWGVYKRDGGELVAEHSSKRKARAQIVAIEVSEGMRRKPRPWTHWLR